MRSLFLLLLPVSVASVLHAQNPDQAIPRNLRFLTVGGYPPPTFEKQNGTWMEVDPPAKWIPPRGIKPKPEPGVTPAPETKVVESILRFNEIAYVPAYRCPAKLRLSLESVSGAGKSEKEISCELGGLVEPLILIFADPQGGWDQPQIRVMDFSAAAFPVGTTCVFNLTPFLLGTKVENIKGDLAPNQRKIIPTSGAIDRPLRYRVDVTANSTTVPLANSSYRLRAEERFLIVAIPDATIKNRPPVNLRLITDRLSQMKAAAEEK